MGINTLSFEVIMLLFEWDNMMFGLKKILLWNGICMSVLMLNACASAVFPDFEEDEDDVVVAEGGRVERELPKEGNSLKADSENAAYEDEEPVDETEKVASAETKPVVSEEIETVDEDKVVIPEKKTPASEEKSKEEPYVPSVSYRVETIYFANGSAAVDAQYSKALRKIVKTAKEKEANIIVYGYASSRTRNTDPVTHKLVNFKVSLERAENVAAALRKAGMPASKIKVEALSDTAPAYLEVMPEGERLNRRAEIYINY